MFVRYVSHSSLSRIFYFPPPLPPLKRAALHRPTVYGRIRNAMCTGSLPVLWLFAWQDTTGFAVLRRSHDPNATYNMPLSTGRRRVRGLFFAGPPSSLPIDTHSLCLAYTPDSEGAPHTQSVHRTLAQASLFGRTAATLYAKDRCRLNACKAQASSCCDKQQKTRFHHQVPLPHGGVISRRRACPPSPRR